MIIELILIENAEWQPQKGWLESLCAHQLCEFNMIETIIIGHIWRGKLNKCHAKDEHEEKPERKKYGEQAFLHRMILAFDQRVG